MICKVPVQVCLFCFFNWALCLLLLFGSYLLWNQNPLSSVYVANKCLHPFCGLPCHSLYGVFKWTQVLNFNGVKFIGFFLYGSCFLCLVLRLFSYPQVKYCRYSPLLFYPSKALLTLKEEWLWVKYTLLDPILTITNLFLFLFTLCCSLSWMFTPATVTKSQVLTSVS